MSSMQGRYPRGLATPYDLERVSADGVMFEEDQSYIQGYPTELTGSSSSLLFSPQQEVAAESQVMDQVCSFAQPTLPIYAHYLQSTWPTGYLDTLWDNGAAPLSDADLGGVSPVDTFGIGPYFNDNASPSGLMMSNELPRINVNTSSLGPYTTSDISSTSSMVPTPMTPGFISPSQTGYQSSPNQQNLSPPTPLLMLNRDGFFGNIASAPVSPVVGFPGRNAPSSATGSRQRATSYSDLMPFSEVPRGPLVPQRRYKPHTTSDRRRYVDEVQLEEPILFYMAKPYEEGISMNDALHNRFSRLHDRDEAMFKERGPSISVRINWPGYAPWSRQIPTRDFRNPPGPITRAKLAKNVAKSVQRFIQDHEHRPMEEDGEPQWRVGRGRIDVFDIVLVRLEHVSKGSWQAQLQLLHPRHA
ncbi:hypothetical protein EWM64_g7510 [Hericium alpestre]|uniref:Uncharacterized protein n=1 Tax=Hericium alpestre TaxID=135208 RepID=A0A4Y9ZR46_9AGAM|nr:hypothetical protein EWM64_g7510 [Hericium alpestre]